MLRSIVVCLVSLLFTTFAYAAPTLTAPATAKMGSELTVQVTGAQPRDFVTIVPKGSPEGRYDAYTYASKPGALKLRVPAAAGEFEIRILGADSPYPTLVKRPLKIEAVAATLEAPAQVAGGAAIQVQWTGPNNAGDYIGIADLKPGSSPYVSYRYTSQNPVELIAPDAAGEYELRYFLNEGNKVIGTRRITIGQVNASLKVPAQVTGGAPIRIEWNGPNNPRDFITIVKAGTADRVNGPYVYTANGKPATLAAPDAAGDYELRYMTGTGYSILARANIKVTPASASVQGPAEAVAGTSINVKWHGPNNERDYISVAKKGSSPYQSGNYTYTARGNPLVLLLPLEPGDYELRYATAQSHTTLATAPIRITPAKQEPGMLVVSSAPNTKPRHAVEIILDASGSMLQRLGQQRRIDIAKQTLTQLTTKTIPAGTPFAFRVFGREVDSCQTDLDIPLAPLNATAVAAKIATLEAKNGAKTPIGASLEKVASDLKSATGERLVILITDGEETCDGDPAATIQALRKSGTQLRINIVGFAIDDQKLAATFRQWSDLGGGVYLDAKDGAGLNKALTAALQPAFEVVAAQGQVIAEGLVGGDPVRVPAGTHSLRIKGATAGAPITIKPKETTSATL